MLMEVLHNLWTELLVDAVTGTLQRHSSSRSHNIAIFLTTVPKRLTYNSSTLSKRRGMVGSHFTGAPEIWARRSTTFPSLWQFSAGSA